MNVKTRDPRQKRQMETAGSSCVCTGKPEHVNKQQSVAWKKTGNDMCTDPNAGLKSPFTAQISADHLPILQILFSFRLLPQLDCVLQI